MENMVGLLVFRQLRLAAALFGWRLRLLPDWSSRSAHVYLVYPTRQQPERVRLLSEHLLGAFASIANV